MKQHDEMEERNANANDFILHNLGQKWKYLHKDQVHKGKTGRTLTLAKRRKLWMIKNKREHQENGTDQQTDLFITFLFKRVIQSQPDTT